MQMTVKVRCPNPDCRQAFKAADEKLGKQGRCKECGTRFTFAAAGKTVAPNVTHAESNATSSPPTNVNVKRLGRFEIRGKLGSGAFGTVFRAHDPQLDREVALKVPHAARLGNPLFVKRFLNEAKLAARLQHPSIVPVFDAGKDGKRYYIASAFIEGGTLDAALDKQTLDFRHIARIVMQLAEALAYAHKQNIIHRDVKPDNVMLDANGEPHLMDFGLARLETSDEKLTQGGGILGTPAYMSPEQARGDKDESEESDEPDESNLVTAASDQYSLGVTLYEMLCGELPFSGPPEIVIFNVIQTEPPTPRSIKAEIPKDLETICQKAMSKERDRRYADCQELAAELQCWLDDEPIHARQISLLERVQRWCRRNPAVAGLTGSIVLVVMLAFVLVTWLWRAAVVAQAVAESAKVEAVAARNEAVEARNEAVEAQNEAVEAQRNVIKAQSVSDNAQTKAAESKGDRTLAQANSILRADIRQVSLIVESLQPFWPEVVKRLEQYKNKKDLTEAERLRLSLALVSHDKTYVEPLRKNLLTCKPVDFIVIRDALLPYRDELKNDLWAIVSRSDATREQRLRAACALATFDPDSSQWTDSSDFLAGELELAREKPLALQTYWDALRPVPTKLLEAFEEDVDKRIADTATEDQKEVFAQKQANAAVALLKLDQADKAWLLLKHSPDPRVRSYLIHWISPLGVDPQTLIGRLDTEPEVSIRRALLLALGEFSEQQLPAQQRQPVIDKLLTVYEQEPDPGLHGAAEWLLRQWGAAKQLEAIDARLPTNEAKLQQGNSKRQWYVTTEGQTMVILNANTFLMGSPDSEPDRESGETLHRRSIGRKFAISSKEVTKAQFRAFEQANPGIKHNDIERWSKTDDSPQVLVEWYDAAAYCNWLSEQEGIPQTQWCYLPNRVNKYAAGMEVAANYLTRTGYRLPSEAEWEYACRAGSVTSRYYGLTTNLLSKYAWYLENFEKRSWPVGRLKPNDFGLFDMHGNARECCHGRHGSYVVNATEQAVADAPEMESVQNNQRRVLRGGSFNNRMSTVRSANRDSAHPGLCSHYDGFRPARTYR